MAQHVAGVPFADGVSHSIHDTRSVRGLTLAAIAIPEQMRQPAGRIHSADRLFRLSRRLAGVACFGAIDSCHAGGFDDNADLCRGLAALAAAGSPEYSALAAALALMVGLLLFAAGRPAGLDRGSFSRFRDDRLPCRHSRSSHFAIACHPRVALACGPNAVGLAMLADI